MRLEYKLILVVIIGALVLFGINWLALILLGVFFFALITEEK